MSFGTMGAETMYRDTMGSGTVVGVTFPNAFCFFLVSLHVVALWAVALGTMCCGTTGR